MQENSLTSCFNVGVDGVSSDKPDQSANQEETPAESTPAVTQLETLTKVKLESSTEEVLVKEEPGTRSQVITAEFYRKFIEASTGYGKPPVNPKDERDYIRILKQDFGKALEPFKTSANTYPFDEEVANSVFIALHTERRNQTQLFKHNEFCLQHIKQLLQYGVWQNELRQNIETEVISRLAVLDRPLKQFAGIVERVSSDLKSKLDAYNKDIVENHSKRIIKEKFLSNLWDENEMNESDIKIKMLKEDDDDLTRELRVKSRSLRDAQEQVDRLRKEKSEWRELYLNAAPAKHSAEDTHAHPSGDKRSRKEVSDTAYLSSSIFLCYCTSLVRYITILL
jgi:hypothetical protein